MNKILAIIHTTPVTIETLKFLAAKYLPGYKVINYLDDSILPQLIENGGKIEEVRDRLIQYAKYAEQAGATVILNACSSVGELVDVMRQQVSVPVVRIDEEMAEEAIRRGRKIGVVATLSTTLNPTISLLQRKAVEMNKQVEIEPLLVAEAYECLLNGDKASHDEMIAETLKNIIQKVDIVVLAQASMARSIEKFPKDIQTKFLTSPELGMEKVKRIAKGLIQ
ncbi:aspartate/glutamate racemase family protein [Parageobacillus sp. VR-IP]|uniref:aspartate/glutamate racemase family protein n=1 Tax=Parageobacillus sp. VR-IP TaxID=2742205 RepID=UPI00158325DD|nr:aspartate/glutamate racemase family protein [Parageobacillus sp. VR-IP]NUK30257.1 aspartate/glutamate racemase family protein [Parageobacillus sp. VR-IP]